MNKIGFMQSNICRVTHSYPSPIISCIHKAPHAAEISRITSPSSENRHPKSFVDESTASNVLKDVHISTQLLNGFLEVAKDNTSKDLETCGVLGAFLKERTYYVTTLIIPKQDATSSSCQAVNEEEIFAIQNEQSLVPVGWIHVFPSNKIKGTFVSSLSSRFIYNIQVMLPEAVAIVMAPTDASRSYGFFRLSDPDGMNILRECQERGFHTHQEPVDGTSLYEDCSNIYLNPNLRLEICDLRHLC
ncbi:AMSH-like ubiquitin thioesterase 2 [Cynara cardunculus var. scolymus]|uniref:AMSH-like ubiquitin thioesterase 2 n=1 Tax=Cynara cardunculus var. scolymus TaxID=59895 RepID=UPI000D629F82|nr:AMSH-like ubiquitin thioesterase 2 [Cynara cardunculus var. scolymus]